MAAKVLVVGSGGREHELALALLESPSVGHVIVTPGNAPSVAVLAQLGFVFERAVTMPGDDAPLHLHACRLAR